MAIRHLLEPKSSDTIEMMSIFLFLVELIHHGYGKIVFFLYGSTNIKIKLAVMQYDQIRRIFAHEVINYLGQFSQK
jgi:hypothetical protein